MIAMPTPDALLRHFGKVMFQGGIGDYVLLSTPGAVQLHACMHS